MASSKRTSSDKALIKPRSNVRDTFEQNPLADVADRLEQQGGAHTPEEDQELIREAVRRLVEDGATVNMVAKEFGLAPSSICQWRLRYDDFLRTSWETNAAAGDETAHLPAEHQARFAENWQRLLAETHATSQDFKQDPLEVFLETSSFTSWLYSDEGRLERSTLVGAIVAVVGVFAVLVFLLTDRMPAATSPGAATKVSIEEKPRHDLDVQRGGQVALEFLRADGWSKKLNFIYHEAQMHDLVRDFFQRWGDQPITDGELKYGMVGDGIVSVSIEVPSRNRNLFFHLIPSGSTYKIDWKSSSLFQAENIENFIHSQSKEPVEMVVHLSRGNYYNHQWADESQCSCFEITFPGLERKLYGYAGIDSQVGIQLRILTGIRDKSTAVIEARFPEHPKDPRQVEIVRIIREEWLERDDAAERLQSAEIQ